MLLKDNFEGFQHLGIPVENITRAKNWYIKVLGFKVIYETVLKSDTGDTRVSFLKLKDIVIELYQPSGEELEEIKARDKGHIDHLAISMQDIYTGLQSALSKGAVLDASTPYGPVLVTCPGKVSLLFANLKGPQGEIVQFQQDSLAKLAGRKDNINGWAHLGIAVTDLDRSKMFYGNFGFREIMNAVVKDRYCLVKVSVLEKSGFKIELSQPEGICLEAAKIRKTGHIDHVAFRVADVEKAFKELKAAGFTLLQDSPVFLPFWSNGVKYIDILGPDGEKVEFIQIL
ncbi:MAG: VOC family protein [Clostridiaceae bacterium]